MTQDDLMKEMASKLLRYERIAWQAFIMGVGLGIIMSAIALVLS